MIFGLFGEKEADDFARRLAKELNTRVPAAAMGKGSRAEAALARALKHVAAKGEEYSRAHKVSIVKQVRMSRTLQAELGALGYEDEFIKETTLALARAMRAK